ncbi:hypothetical protein TNCT_718211, partial [Trichonephila clavata]
KPEGHDGNLFDDAAGVADRIL